MLKNKTIANAGWIIACKIVQAVLGVVISMLTARYLGPSNFGLIHFAASVVAFVTPIATLGLNHIIVQEVLYSPKSEGKILGTSMIMSLISSVFCICGVISFTVITSPMILKPLLYVRCIVCCYWRKPLKSFNIGSRLNYFLNIHQLYHLQHILLFLYIRFFFWQLTKVFIGLQYPMPLTT